MTSKEAYKRALKEGPSSRTREIVKRSPIYSMLYAVVIDGCPHPITRKGACSRAKYAYIYAYKVDKQPRDDTRKAVLRSPAYSFFYARDVDKQPRDDTREAASKDPYYAYAYMVKIDRGYHPTTYEAVLRSKSADILFSMGLFLGFNDDIRRRIFDISPEYSLRIAKVVDRNHTSEAKQAVLTSPRHAYLYSRDVLKRPDDELRSATLKNPEYAYLYARDIDKQSRDDTRKAACRNPKYAYLYALHIDKYPRDDTREAACKSTEYAYLYAKDIDMGYHEMTYNRIIVSKDFNYAYKYATEVLGTHDDTLYRIIVEHSYTSTPQNLYEKKFMFEPSISTFIRSESIQNTKLYIDSLGLLDKNHEKDLFREVSSRYFYKANPLQFYLSNTYYIDLDLVNTIVDSMTISTSDVKRLIKYIFGIEIDDLQNRLKTLQNKPLVESVL